MCDFVVLADKYGIAGLVILALFALQLIRLRADEKTSRDMNEDIKANTKATIELTSRSGSVCQSRRMGENNNAV